MTLTETSGKRDYRDSRASWEDQNWQRKSFAYAKLKGLTQFITTTKKWVSKICLKLQLTQDMLESFKKKLQAIQVSICKYIF